MSEERRIIHNTRQRQWYVNNKSYIIRRNKEKVTCPLCGRQLRRDGGRKHRQSKVHKESSYIPPPQTQPVFEVFF